VFLVGEETGEEVKEAVVRAEGKEVADSKAAARGEVAGE
jgi:hypothetical protein